MLFNYRVQAGLPQQLMKVLLILFSCFVLIFASSRTDEANNPNSNLGRSLTESSFTRYSKSESIPIRNDKEGNDVSMSSSFSAYNNRKMSFSPPGKRGLVSPIADPNFHQIYWGGRKHLGEDNFFSTSEDKKEGDDSGSSSDGETGSKKSDTDLTYQDDEMFFEMDDHPKN